MSESAPSPTDQASAANPGNAMYQPHRITRLLPWSGPEGKPCYLLTDGEGGHLSRIADNIESVQLGMGRELLGHARALSADPKTGVVELRYLSARLTESLQDVLRVAESRGARLAGPRGDDEEEDAHGQDLDLRPAAGPAAPLEGEGRPSDLQA
ncbi:hypothetical protein ACLVWQ_11295 [Streptomyces sp. CWNU-52B]|uniref:hypothetical protein n=1 Tax=unclassified Streptomyces TaxID=2593676 RepID=UPI0039C11BBC